MPIVYPANQVQTNISIAIEELEIEANNLIDKLSLDIDKKISNGVNANVAKKQVLDEVKAGTGIFKTWSNTQKRIIKDSTKGLVAKPIMLVGSQDPNQKFNWVLSGSVKNHCADCARLSGMEPRTLNEWRALGFGLPREGGTICKNGCRCMLSKNK